MQSVYVLCRVPARMHNGEGIWVLPRPVFFFFFSFCAAADPHIISICYYSSGGFFFFWPYVTIILYSLHWTGWMQNMLWEAFINKTLHLFCLFFFSTQQTIICFREVVVHLLGFETAPAAVLFLFVRPVPQWSYGRLMTGRDFDTDLRRTFLTLQVINFLINSCHPARLMLWLTSIRRPRTLIRGSNAFSPDFT